MNINFKISMRVIVIAIIVALTMFGIYLMENAWCEDASGLIYSTGMECVVAIYVIDKLERMWKENK